MSGDPTFDRLPELIEAASGVVGETELETVLRRLVREARSATGARYAALGVLGEHGVLSDFVYDGISEKKASQIGSLPRGRGVLGTVIRERRTIRVDDIGRHPDSYGFPEHHPSMKAFLGVPVVAGNRAFGNLYLTDKEGGFTDADAVLVEALSRIAGSAVSTARLQNRLRRVAVVEDRERIARDLHDSVIQDLFSVGLSLQALAGVMPDHKSAETLDQAVDRLDGAVESLRNYVFRLKSPASAPSRLDENLHEIASRMGGVYAADVTLHLDLVDDPDPAVSGEIEMLVTEALSNALRHSGAEAVTIRVESSVKEWAVIVEDDGSGFDIASSTRGHGLLNMQTRASRLGAQYSLESAPGSGTKVEIRFVSPAT